MSKEFDYVAFAREFEATNGRPPTAEELDEAKWSHYGIKWHTPEESQAELERIKATYKPSFWERFKVGLSFLGHGFFKALFFILMSPLYLTMLFFNLIKSAIGVFVIWFVSKFMFGLIIGIITDVKYGSNLESNPFPTPFREIIDFILGKDFFLNAVPSFFPHPVLDAWIIGIVIILLALIATFSKVEES
ncbi:hypothetical protein UG96_01460 [Streptococcus gallolyticus subsp. gallolyticus]|uniref:Uncharacterized protein n=1 Tax=Streptococcus gallolyticus (strain UCN34) TaxID=637909 RepID=A0AA36JX28_STRG3|nr:hypothetical protein [Streptococcus gallolyticus]KJF00388.1 hypothetical protein UG96_01460 [Streptococcus gallolyticus subsp. gallolyticus]CBI12766.1 hypothetical protein GALLO_0274 [Streptococcus gallolyticus UCN34]